MAKYALKTYGRNNHLMNTFEFSAPSDAEAEAAVADLDEIRHTHELWCGNRWIRTWPSRDRAA